MTCVRQTIELHTANAAYWVEFVRDVVGHWHAEVELPGGSKWSFEWEVFGPFTPNAVQAKRFVRIARQRVNSGRAA